MGGYIATGGIGWPGAIGELIVFPDILNFWPTIDLQG